MSKVEQDLRNQAEQLREQAKNALTKQAYETLTVVLGDIIDDYKAVADYSTQKLTEVVEPLESGSKRLNKAVNEVSITSNEMKSALAEVLRLTKDLSVASVDTYKEQVKTLEDNISKLEQREREARYRANKADLGVIFGVFKKYSLLLVFVAAIVFGGVIFEGEYVTEQITQTLAIEYESLYKTFEKRAELQQSVEAYDEYYNYCIETYVKCPFIGSCSKAQEEYTNNIFIPKFGYRPGTTPIENQEAE